MGFYEDKFDPYKGVSYPDGERWYDRYTAQEVYFKLRDCFDLIGDISNDYEINRDKLFTTLRILSDLITIFGAKAEEESLLKED